MNTPQVWAVIAVMAAGVTSMITLVFRYMNARFDAVDARFDALTARMDDRFTAFEARFDHLDRNVQRVIERVFP